MTPDKIYAIDKGTAKELAYQVNSVSINGSPDEPAPPVNIGNSYQFSCSFKMDKSASDALSALIAENFPANFKQVWKRANRLRDELNDMIEEYHAPGNSRRVRRQLKRDFDKTFRIFRAYCKEHGIEYGSQNH